MPPYFKISKAENCKNWSTLSVNLQPYDNGYKAHTKVEASRPSLCYFLIAEPFSGGVFHVGLVAENEWKCNGETYKFMLVHEWMGSNGMATVRVHLYKSYDEVKKEMNRCVSGSLIMS